MSKFSSKKDEEISLKFHYDRAKRDMARAKRDMEGSLKMKHYASAVADGKVMMVALEKLAVLERRRHVLKVADPYKQHATQGHIESIPASERDAWREEYRHNKGEISSGGITTGDRVKYGRSYWWVYDLDADSKATHGVTLVLVNKNFSKMAKYVDISDLE